VTKGQQRMGSLEATYTFLKELEERLPPHPGYKHSITYPEGDPGGLILTLSIGEGRWLPVHFDEADLQKEVGPLLGEILEIKKHL